MDQGRKDSCGEAEGGCVGNAPRSILASSPMAQSSNGTISICPKVKIKADGCPLTPWLRDATISVAPSSNRARDILLSDSYSEVRCTETSTPRDGFSGFRIVMPRTKIEVIQVVVSGMSK